MEYPILRSTARVLVALALVLGAMTLHAQTATNNCGYNGGNQYPVGNSCSYSTFDKPSSFSNNYNASGCSGGNNDDAWGWFTATSTVTNITYDPDNNHRSIVHVYTGTCTAGLTQVACVNSGGNGNDADITSLATTPGTNYMIRVQRHNDNGAMDGRICIWSPLPPTNDDPCAATSLTVNSTCSTTAGTTVLASATAGVGNPSCGTYSGADVWYTFVAPANGIATIRTEANSMTNSAIALYTAGSCAGAFTQVACSVNGNGNMGQLLQSGLTPGQTYYVRVWGESGTGTFGICVVSLPNDQPCGAQALTLGGSCSATATTTAYSTSTAGIPAPGCANYTGNDVWYSFVASATGVANIETTAGSLTNSGMALYSASACNGTFTLIECDADDGPGNMSQINRTGLTPGQTYYIRMWGEGSNDGTFSICVWTPPINDDPCTAIDLNLGSSCSLSAETNAGASATSGIPLPGCGNGAYYDVWYRFTAPSNGLVTLRTAVGSLANPQFAVYRASSCSGPFTLVKCDNASGPGNAPFITLTPLEIIPGETYYVRVWGNNGNTGTFDLCGYTAPATGSCIYVLRMWDSQGNGWGNSSVSIQVGAGPAVSYANTNADEDVAYIPVSIGQSVTLSYATGGSGNQGEIRYALQLVNGPLYADGPNPGTGPRWAGTVNCQSAAPLSSDCVGGAGICDSQQINANPSNTGLATDMNIHTRGCLNNNERQGLWYRFTISQSGTLGFTLTPEDVDDDYDFAVWGPYPSHACPPDQAPVRCNYSGTTGNTGVSSAGTNPSEGAGGSKWSSLMSVTAGQNYLLYVSNWSQSGLAFNLSWQLTNGASLDCTLLPIQLLDFRGAPVPQGIRLDWSTASESNSALFVVERMDEAGAFQGIGELAAAGYSTSTTAYEFLDQHPLPGFNHYRLKMVDADGSSALSEVISVANRYGGFVGGLFPNPATDRISAVMDGLPEGEATGMIHDASGRLVHSGTLIIAAGQSIISLPLNGLERGHYALSVAFGTDSPLHAGRFMVE